MPYAQRGNRTFQEIWLCKEQFLCHVYRQCHTNFIPFWVNSHSQSCDTPDMLLTLPTRPVVSKTLIFKSNEVPQSTEKV